MKVLNSHGSKERLFEMMERVNRIQLNEEVLPENNREDIIVKFTDWVANKFNFTGDIPHVKISYGDDEAKKNKSFGGYTPATKEILVIATNRNLADILRSLAHELVHHKQNKEGVLTSESGKDGSEHENEANALAGSLLREFGRENPQIFE